MYPCFEGTEAVVLFLIDGLAMFFVFKFADFAFSDTAFLLRLLTLGTSAPLNCFAGLRMRGSDFITARALRKSFESHFEFFEGVAESAGHVFRNSQ